MHISNILVLIWTISVVDGNNSRRVPAHRGLGDCRRRPQFSGILAFLLLPDSNRTSSMDGPWHAMFVWTGLCGSYDGNPYNDLRHRNGSVYQSTTDVHSWSFPAEYCADWRYENAYSHVRWYKHTGPLLSKRHHRSSGDCLEGKGENYQVCSVQYCVQQLCTVRCTPI